MKREIMEVEKERFSLKDNNLYLVQGSWIEGYTPAVFLDKEPIQNITCSKKEETIEIGIPMPEYAGKYKKIYIYGIKDTKKILWFSEKVSKISKTEYASVFYRLC